MNRPNTYDVGDRVRVWGPFATTAKVDTDPTTVICKYQDPSGNETTKTYGIDGEVIKSSTGRYYLDIDVDEAGTWYYRWEGTGVLVAAGEQSFVVRETQFA